MTNVTVYWELLGLLIIGAVISQLIQLHVGSIIEGENLTLICNANGSGVTFEFRTRESNQSVTIAECFEGTTNCYLLPSSYESNFTVKHTDKGGLLTILNLRESLYGIYTCIVTFATDQKASVNISAITVSSETEDKEELSPAVPTHIIVTCSCIVFVVMLVFIGYRCRWFNTCSCSVNSGTKRREKNCQTEGSLIEHGCLIPKTDVGQNQVQESPATLTSGPSTAVESSTILKERNETKDSGISSFCERNKQSYNARVIERSKTVCGIADKDALQTGKQCYQPRVKSTVFRRPRSLSFMSGMKRTIESGIQSMSGSFASKMGTAKSAYDIEHSSAPKFEYMFEIGDGTHDDSSDEETVAEPNGVQDITQTCTTNTQNRIYEDKAYNGKQISQREMSLDAEIPRVSKIPCSIMDLHEHMCATK